MLEQQVELEPADMPPPGSIAAAVAHLSRALTERREVRVEGARGPARAALLAALARSAARPILVLTPTLGAAEVLSQDLRFFLGEVPEADALHARVHVLPAWDGTPFAPMSPSSEAIAQRIAGLFHLSQTKNPIVITTPEAVLQRAMGPALLRSGVAYLVEGEEVDLSGLVANLVDWGYRRRALVEDRGDLAVRGGLLDVFVTGQADPVRLELVGDLLDSIRTFDPRTQRRIADREEALILPASEIPLHARRNPAVLKRIEDRTREVEMLRRDRLLLLDALSEGTALPGLEWLAPYFIETVPLLEYLPADSLVVLDDVHSTMAAADDAWQSVQEHLVLASEERRLHPAADELYSTPEALRESLAHWPRLVLEPLETGHGGDESSTTTWAKDGDLSSKVAALTIHARRPFEVRATRLARDGSGFMALAEQIRAWMRAGARIALVVGSATQADRLQKVLESHDMHVPAVGDALPDALDKRTEPGPFIVEGDLSASLWLPEDLLACVAEVNLFGEHRRSRRRQAVALTLDQVMRSLEQLKADDFVVHLDHGIGLYRGLRHMSIAGSEGDFLHLEYQGGDKLYVPVDRVNLVQKYIGGDGAEPELDKLGGTSWERVKQKTKESILAMAHELLDLYATRQRHAGHSFSTDDPYYQEFEARFPFEETPDQARAIREVIDDLGKSKPMDRLVCGDVGYGKTEVAMRGAFVVAMEGRQAAFLVPTTVLAQQHFETLRKRFAEYPVRLDMLSSFRTRKENQEVVERLKTGEVDIVVGTHRLLQPDVEFARLGLLVVDEEHRFGVRDKERIKQMRKLVDVLTLSATPIPRTLELSLSGIRDLSVIETPPLDRQAIRTYVTRYDDSVIRDAILRELERGGQIFFVHNRVESIERMAEKLRMLVPEARVVVGHGQMREHALEKVMLGFLRHESDVLCCSAIIESGLDIPNANTILIHRADTFGLAQLYQLRGRVGRSPARAYAYLLIPGEQMLTKDAKLRLQVLQELDDLGGGFKIAAHDLEIRGAGNLLGKQQSGHITAVGFELYTRMMEEAVHELRGEPVAEELEPEIQLGVPAYIPDAYIDDVNQRLVCYKRLAALKEAADRDAFAAELRDRYGPLPAIVEKLLSVMDLRRRMKALRMVEAKVRGSRVAFRLHPTSPVPSGALVELVQAGERRSLSPDGTLTLALAPGEDALAAVGRILTMLEDRVRTSEEARASAGGIDAGVAE